jgi:hypothetical protein
MNLLPLLLVGALAHAAQAETIEADIVIYGGTASGVSAACTAVKFGKRVALAEFGQHIGGLTSGGLGWTDIGNKAAIGGFSRTFYQRLGKHYGKAEAWTFEPSVAERELRALLTENKVPVKFAQRLKTVKKEGTRIVEISMEDGTVYRGKMFIDTTYEGDLMAMAGVKYMVGREANAQFGETLNGIRAETPQHQFLVPVDPYVRAGDAASGLLPFVLAQAQGTPGDGDRSVQAYNFRLCLTKKRENQLPIEPPPGYAASRYELLGRYFEALAAARKKVTLGNFLKFDMVTPEKTDINNQGGFSTDYIGANHAYAEADYATRAKIWEDHLHYIQGLLTFLKTDERVPANVRADMAAWGLCRDEFQDTGGWPHAMYVREARRLVGEYIMSERTCRGVEKPEDAVGLGAYNMDSHNCRRIVRDGKAYNEGDVQVGVKPYPISYRSLIPRAAECENLLVPICLSATHIAYGSIRMEPVFMILGQSAATAASFAIDDRVPVQKVPYAKLREQLLKDSQVLAWVSAIEPPAPPKLEGIVLDDTQAEKTGDWLPGSLGPRVGPGYVHDNNANKGTMSVKWTAKIPEAGEYRVTLHYPPAENRATNVPVVIETPGATPLRKTINERAKEARAELGVIPLAAGATLTITLSNKDTNGHVIADGVQIEKVK